jgi:hypothetical protein
MPLKIFGNSGIYPLYFEGKIETTSSSLCNKEAIEMNSTMQQQKESREKPERCQHISAVLKAPRSVNSSGILS